jgi:hypothetical protein
VHARPGSHRDGQYLEGNDQGHSIAEFPLVVGVIGAVFAPVLAAVGALAAVLTECTIEVEREQP